MDKMRKKAHDTPPLALRKEQDGTKPMQKQGKPRKADRYAVRLHLAGCKVHDMIQIFCLA